MTRSSHTDLLQRELLKVVSNGNCSGCAGCALASSRVEMEMSPAGFLRPTVSPKEAPVATTNAKAERNLFRRICPGVSVTTPPVDAQRHPELGPYVSVWDGAATDDVLRHSGSSAGVLSALGRWLLETGQVKALAAAAGSAEHPTMSDGVRVEDPSRMQASGSRYAPVSSISRMTPGNGDAAIAKPCEVSAVRRLEESMGAAPSVLLSFFCAGTPSQLATDDLVIELGATTKDVAKLRYRGNGWPGSFEIVTHEGEARSLPYADAWSRVLGRQIQTRCRICADGTGMLADIAVADYWEADEKGYPRFTESVGRSAVIARTARGHQLLLDAAAAGVVALSPMTIEDLAGVQPVQLTRQRTMTARLIARRLMGKRVPRYRGMRLWRLAVRRPVLSAMHLAGTIVRTRREVVRSHGPHLRKARP